MCFIKKKIKKSPPRPLSLLQNSSSPTQSRHIVPFPPIGLLKWANKSFSMWAPCRTEVAEQTGGCSRRSGRKWDLARRHSVTACPSKQPSPFSTHARTHLYVFTYVADLYVHTQLVHQVQRHWRPFTEKYCESLCLAVNKMMVCG